VADPWGILLGCCHRAHSRETCPGATAGYPRCEGGLQAVATVDVPWRRCLGDFSRLLLQWVCPVVDAWRVLLRVRAGGRALWVMPIVVGQYLTQGGISKRG
jgi:hypothetical protein